MAKTKSTSQFRAYDLSRKTQHIIDCPAVQSQQYKLDPGEWATAIDKGPAARTRAKTKVAGKKSRISKPAKAKKPPQRPWDVLKANQFDACLQCGQTGEDPTCGAKCHQQFRKQYITRLIDIKGPGPHGYGAFTKPGISIKKGQYLDEYVGEVRPSFDYLSVSDSTYVFYMSDTAYPCNLDAEKTGNWTRFMNSHCRPNVRVNCTNIGKRHVVVFEAKEDISPEEELTFNYGPAYFKAAGFDCRCSRYKNPHVPCATR